MPVTNYNIAVAATSGAGKSFLIQNIIANTLSHQGFVAVIDVGGSYTKLCHSLNGAYIDAASLHLNPFAGVVDIKQDIGGIVPILCLMASPDGQLTSWQVSKLKAATMSVFSQHGRQSTISHIVKELKKMVQEEAQDALQVDLERMLVPLNDYSPDNPDSDYGKYFVGPSLFDKDSSFVVLELQELSADLPLMKVVLLSLMSLIYRQFYLTERKRPKMCVIDEAWRFFEDEDMGVKAFINEGFRTARRFNGSYVAVTQGMPDYFLNSTTEAIWNNSSYKYILLQDQKSFEDLVNNKPNLFDGYQQRMIKHFKPAHANGFSEFMVQAGATYSFHRLFVDPFARVLFSTAPEEFQAVKDLQAQGLPLDQAISQVAKANYPQDFTH